MNGLTSCLRAETSHMEPTSCAKALASVTFGLLSSLALLQHSSISVSNFRKWQRQTRRLRILRP